MPSFPTQDALQIIEAELGRRVEDVFEGLDTAVAPVAAASLGQVYRTRLRGSGLTVALKVQRPDMLQVVSLDLYLLRLWARGIEIIKEVLPTAFANNVLLFPPSPPLLLLPFGCWEIGGSPCMARLTGTVGGGRADPDRPRNIR